MDVLRFFVRLISILLLMSLSIYTTQDPLFPEIDISQVKGEMPLYFVEINRTSDGDYVTELGFPEKKEFFIKTDAELKKGNVVTFYGMVENRHMVASKYHIHNRPNTPYYISIIGFFLFLWLFLKDWKLDRNSFRVRRR